MNTSQVRFRIEIPEANLRQLSSTTHRRLRDQVDRLLTPETREWDNATTPTRTFSGDGPPELVTLLTALARGDDIGPVLDRLEAG